MFRKRKSPSPHFRMPVPYNPVVGGDHSMSPSRPTCRFVLEEELTTSDDRSVGWITNQYGPGQMHPYQNKIVLLNTETDETGVYMFEGEVGDAGIAVWDEGQRWLIVHMIDEGGGLWYVGKTTEAIASETCGMVERHDYSWTPTGEEFEVYNPHDVQIPDDFKVRWTKYPGWSLCGSCETDWVVEPWQWTECPPGEE